MSTNVIPFTGTAPAVFAGRKSNLAAAAKAGVMDSFAVVSVKGKNWRIKYRGEEELVKGADGMPLQRLEVVIVGISPYISKQWYETGFVDGSDAAPSCFSVNGIVPDPASSNKQSETCQACPKNAFDSRITEEGKKAKACQDGKRIVIVPLGKIENEDYGGPMMLRLPITSLPNLKRYAEMIERKGTFVEAVATGLKFDYTVAYPRVEFEALGWLTQEQAIQVVGPDGNGGMCAHPALERMLQEPVDEVDTPAVEPSALDQGAPPAVFAQRQAAIPAGAVEQAAQDPTLVATEPTPPPRRQQVASAFQQQAATPATAPAPEKPATVVQGAPPDMMASIAELLGT